ncbi:hypothetical protein EV187_1031 [Agromyces ramosus]|uniref:Uncharacterized protein n=1 Tax=Agromyces ramosus TaxID=33879 RepID=A0A4V2F034_9MICO|nr:hypothetical protein [Agromyces ramosus]RZS68600.1 hypothetical protein EV187_1031 [Agromyces ramosus]
MSDEQQAEEPMRRPRGRHRGRPAVVAPAGDGWRARLAAAAAPVVASVEPRIAVAAEWLFERRLHVLIVAASVATIAMIGGAVALISFAGAPQPEDEAATVVETPRPTSTDPASPNTYAPILPSPGPTPSVKPTAPATPAPSPDGDPDAPATEPPAEPTTEPVTEEPAGRPDPPGHTNKPDKPKP